MTVWHILKYILVFVGVTILWFPELGIPQIKGLVCSMIGFGIWFILDIVMYKNEK
jgi:uncharacterized membrane protein